MPLLPGSEKIPAGEAIDFKAFVLRVEPTLHRRIMEAAADERVSMNIYLNRILDREVPAPTGASSGA